MKIVPSEEEINKVLNACAELAEGDVHKFPGMTYAEGVETAILWLVGYSKENPLSD